MTFLYMVYSIYRKILFLLSPGIYLLAWVLFPIQDAYGQDELKVKGMYIMNFFKYMEQPTPVEKYRLIVLGKDEYEFYKDMLDGKIIKQIKIVVLPFSEEALELGHLIYVPSSHRKAVSILNEKAPKAIIIGDGFSIKNSIPYIKLFSESNRMVFTINEGAIEQTGVKIHPNLLALSKR